MRLHGVLAVAFVQHELPIVLHHRVCRGPPRANPRPGPPRANPRPGTATKQSGPIQTPDPDQRNRVGPCSCSDAHVATTTHRPGTVAHARRSAPRHAAQPAQPHEGRAVGADPPRRRARPRRRRQLDGDAATPLGAPPRPRPQPAGGRAPSSRPHGSPALASWRLTSAAPTPPPRGRAPDRLACMHACMSWQVRTRRRNTFARQEAHRGAADASRAALYECATLSATVLRHAACDLVGGGSGLGAEMAHPQRSKGWEWRGQRGQRGQLIVMVVGPLLATTGSSGCI